MRRAYLRKKERESQEAAAASADSPEEAAQEEEQQEREEEVDELMQWVKGLDGDEENEPDEETCIYM